METLLEEQHDRCKRLHESNPTSKGPLNVFAVLISTLFTYVHQIFHLKMHSHFLQWLWRNLESWSHINWVYPLYGSFVFVFKEIL